MEKRIRAIENALWNRSFGKTGDTFEIAMKATGNVLAVKYVKGAPHRGADRR